MRISLDWLNELVIVETVGLEDLVEKLTLGGFEVEESLELMIENRKEIIVDITATANRADSLSIKGIAREVSALLNKPYRISQYSNNTFNSETIIRSSLLTPINFNYCSIFIGVTIENITTLTSPKWLKQRLIGAGIIPVNNLLDFQNYILLETGYPFEFYDLDKIQSKLKQSEFHLTLTSASNESRFLASNQLDYKLNNDILLIKANNEILSIAGVIPNCDFQYAPNTKSLLIEGSIFNSKKIRQTSRFLGLRTDRSARYEKGLNTSQFIESLWRLLHLFKISNHHCNYKIHTVAQNKQNSLVTVSLKHKNIIEILGPIVSYQEDIISQLKPTQVSAYLDRLQFSYIFDKTNLIWEVKIPISRADDITREIDLIEEIGRLHGFNNFITSLPKFERIGNEDFSYQIRKKVTSCFLNEGLNELIHYSFTKNQQTNTIKLINPLLQDCSMLRETLLPNLLKTTSNNLKQGNSILDGFEFGHIFSYDGFSSYQEIEQVGGIFGGIEIKSTWSDNSKSLSWYEAKGKIENIFDKLNLLIYWKTSTPQIYKNLLHPYRISKLCLINGKSIGIFGQIHPILAKQLNISSTIYLFEFNFEMLKNELKYNRLPFYQYYSSYPKIVKDLSFIIDQKISFEEIKKAIVLTATPSLVSIEVLDEYRGKSIPKTSTSLCVQLTFQSFEKTLRNKEIEEIIGRIQFILTKNFNAIARV
jgi:phenylalanyl-tRNA synthetase beta chain